MRVQMCYATCALLTLLAGASNAVAQAPRSVSVDFRLGRGYGDTTGEYLDNHDGTVSEGLLAARLLSIGRVGFIVAAGAAEHNAAEHLLLCRPASNGGCVPGFPPFQLFMAKVGFETAGGAIRALAGPSLARSGRDSALGWSGHVDAGVRVGPWLWLVASVGGHLIPDYRGDSFELATIGAGIRIR